MVSKSYKEIQSVSGLQEYYNKYFKKVKSFLQNAIKQQLFAELFRIYYVNSLSISWVSSALYTQDMVQSVTKFDKIGKKV